MGGGRSAHHEYFAGYASSWRYRVNCSQHSPLLAAPRAGIFYDASLDIAPIFTNVGPAGSWLTNAQRKIPY